MQITDRSFMTQQVSKPSYAHGAASLRARTDTAAGDGTKAGHIKLAKEISPAEKQAVDKLRASEIKVRAHEMAHKAAGGSFAGAINYQYATGPDGKRYIVGGEVSISAPRGNTPSETAANMDRVRAAALAPIDPSPQDRAVASKAAAEAQRARQDAAMKKNGETATDGAGPRNISVFA